jgi:hypothetical protein
MDLALRDCVGAALLNAWGEKDAGEELTEEERPKEEVGKGMKVRRE